MNVWAELAMWAKRARPPRRALTVALGGAVATAATSLALFVGAPYLLFVSAASSHLVAGSELAILLVLIEVLAFARSPIRYAERLGGHELGATSVRAWRRDVLVTVGRWPYRRWRRASDGDLLERAIADTDALQDLWLRVVIPIASSLLVLVAADVVVLTLPSGHLHAGAAATTLVLTTLACAIVVAGCLGPLAAAERALRADIAIRTGVLVESVTAGPEISLLGGGAVLQSRVDDATVRVGASERRRDRRRLTTAVVAATLPLIVVGAVWRAADGGGALLGRSDLIVVLLACAAADALATLRQGVVIAATTTAATSRLGALHTGFRPGDRPWPGTGDIAVEVDRGGPATLRPTAPVRVGVGRRLAIIGPVGSGKSSALRLLAGLDGSPDAHAFVNGVPVSEIDDASLRRHVSYVPASPRLTDGIAERVLTLGRPIDIDVAATMADLGMVTERTTRWVGLSRGESQRVALARALASSPEVLLLDEPTSGLGPPERDLVISRLARFEGILVCATHDEGIVRACDDVVDFGVTPPHDSESPPSE